MQIIKDTAPHDGEGVFSKLKRRLFDLPRRLRRTLRYLNNWLLRSSKVQELAVYLFNVGQGDHILLELPNGEFGIIDFYYEASLGWKEPPALTYLDYLKTKDPSRKITVAFVCISHPDHDHIKGIDYFLEWISRNEVKVRHFWMFAGGDFEKLAARYRTAYEQTGRDAKLLGEAKKVRNRLAKIDNFLTSWNGTPEFLQDVRKLAERIGGALRVILVAPLGHHIERFDEQAWADLFRLILEDKRDDTAERNLVSAVLMMIFQEHRLLFGGDTGEEVWQDCLDQYKELGEDYGVCKGTFIKVSHHGSRNSSSVRLWERLLMPGGTVLGISAGRNKRLGHPHPETLAHITEAAKSLNTKAQILSTNVCRACVGDQRLPEEPLTWLANGGSNKRIRARSASQSQRNPQKPATENLAAYIFRFESQTGTVSLSKGMSSTIAERSQCIYGEQPRKGRFPECVDA